MEHRGASAVIHFRADTFAPQPYLQCGPNRRQDRGGDFSSARRVADEACVAALEELATDRVIRLRTRKKNGFNTTYDRLQLKVAVSCVVLWW